MGPVIVDSKGMNVPSDIIHRSAIFKGSWNFIVPAGDLPDIIVLNEDIFRENIKV